MTTKIINNSEYEILAEERFDLTGTHGYMLTCKTFQFMPLYIVWYRTPQGFFYPHKFMDLNKARADYHFRLAQAYNPQERNEKNEESNLRFVIPLFLSIR